MCGQQAGGGLDHNLLQVLQASEAGEDGRRIVESSSSGVAVSLDLTSVIDRDRERDQRHTEGTHGEVSTSRSFLMLGAAPAREQRIS